MKRSKSNTRITAPEGSSRRDISGQEDITEPRSTPSTNIDSRPLAEDDPARAEHSPEGANDSTHMPADTAWALHTVRRPEGLKRARPTRSKFTSSVASPLPVRPDPSNGIEDTLASSRISRCPSSSTRDVVPSVAIQGKDVQDESQHLIRSKEHETPEKPSQASEDMRSKYKGMRLTPETRRLPKTGVDAAIRLHQRPLLTGHHSAIVTGKSPPPLDEPPRTPRRSSATEYLLSSKSSYDTEDKARSSRMQFPLRGTLPGEREFDAVKAMGDVVCYAARSSKIQVVSTTTTSSSRRSSRSSRGSLQMPSGGVPLVASTVEPSSQTPSTVPPSSSSTEEIPKLQTSMPRSEAVARSTSSIIGGLEDRRRVPSTLGDRRQLEVFVDITRRHHATATEPALATTSRSSSSLPSFVERISARVKIRPGKGGSIREPQKQSELPQPIEIRKQSVEEAYSMNLDRFLPGPDEAHAYTELLEYPKRHPEAAPAPVTEGIDSEQEVDLQRFEFSSKEALAYAQLLDYPIRGPERAPKPIAREAEPEHRVDLEKFMPHSNEAVSYTDLLNYTKRRQVHKAAVTDLEHEPNVNLERFMPHSKEAVAYTDLLGYPKRRSKEVLKHVAKEAEPEPNVDLERFMPHSKEALAYTDLLEYPKRTSMEALKAAAKEVAHEPNVDLEKFMPHSKEAVAYTDLLGYPKRRSKEVLKPVAKGAEPEPNVDLERFMPHSKEALAYTDLLEYPKRTSMEALKAAAKGVAHEPNVDFEKFMPHSKEAAAYTELLHYPKHRPKDVPKPVVREAELEPRVDLERFMPQSKEALAYTDLLEYPKRRRKSSLKPTTTPIRWETEGIPQVSSPSKTFSWTLPSKRPSRPTSRRTSFAQTMGPAKRETTPPPPKPASGVAGRPAPSMPVGPPPPAAPRPRPAPSAQKSKRIVPIRPLVAGFHIADELPEGAGSTAGSPLSSAITVSMKPPPDGSHDTKQRPFARPFYMAIRDKLNEEHRTRELPQQPPQMPPQKPPERYPQKLPAKETDKPPGKPPAPAPVTTLGGLHRRLPAGLRSFKGSAHDSEVTTARARPLITEKKIAASTSKTAAGAPTARPFAIGVQGASSGPSRRRVSASIARRTFRGPVKTAPIHIHDLSAGMSRKPSDASKLTAPLSKRLPPSPPGMRIISMSTGHRDFREPMLWDFSPAPPPKTPQLHSKRASIAQARPVAAPAEASKSLAKESAAVAKSTGAKLDRAKGPTAEINASASLTKKASKEAAPSTKPVAHAEATGARTEKALSASTVRKASREMVTPASLASHAEASIAKAELPTTASGRKLSKEAVTTPIKPAAHAEANAMKDEKGPTAKSTAKISKEAFSGPDKPVVHAEVITSTAEKVPAAKISKETVSAPTKAATHVQGSMTVAAPSEGHASKSSAPAKPGMEATVGPPKDAISATVKQQKQPEGSAAKDVKKTPTVAPPAQHPQETVSKPVTTAPQDKTSATKGEIKTTPARSALATTVLVASEKTEAGVTGAKSSDEAMSAHAKAEVPKSAAVTKPERAPQMKPISRGTASQASTPRRHSIAASTAQAALREHDKVLKEVDKTSSVKHSGAGRRSSSIVIRSIVRTTTLQDEPNAVTPRPVTTPARRPSTESETGVKLEVKPPEPAEPSVDYRLYKACVQVREPEEPPLELPAPEPEKPQKETVHSLHVPDSRALIPAIEEKSTVALVEEIPVPPTLKEEEPPKPPPEKPKAPPPAKKEEPPKPPPEKPKAPPPAKKEEPPKPPPEVAKEEPVSHPVRDFRAAVMSVRKRKAKPRHKCAKHKNETSSQYERRKARVMAKRKAKAKAKADSLIKVEEESSDVKPRRKKTKKKKKKREKDKSESSTSDRQVKKKGDKDSKHRTPSEHYAQSKTSPLLLCCVCLTALIIVGLLAAYFWPEKEVVTTTYSSSSSSTTAVTFLPPYSKIYHCSSDVCKAEAAYLKSLLSANKNPCDNFYEYVCDGWNKAHPVPGTGAGGVQSVDTMLQDRLLVDLEPLLLGVPDADVRVAADLYESCLRRDQVGHDGDTVVGVARQLFRDWAIKEWPVLKPDAVTSSVAWTFAGELVRDLNVAALTSVSVGISPKALENATIELDKPRLLFSCNDASRPAVTDLFSAALTELMTRFASASGKKNVEEVMRVFTRIGSSPASAAIPDSGPLSYTLVKLIDLDNGYKQFLERVFSGVITIDGTTDVVLKSPDYVRNHLTLAMQELPAHAVANYLGFVALTKMAPFFPEKFASSRQVFAKDVLDRTLPDVSQTKTLCLLAVQQLLPGCFAKAALQLRGMWHAVLPLSDWLARLQSSFSRHHELVAWIDELSALVVRYRLKRNRMAALSPGYSEPCAPASNEIPRRSEHPLRFFHQVSMLQEQKRLQAILKSGRDVLSLRSEPRPELATVPEYEVMRQLVHVSMALFNTSVPSNTTVFAFHLSRVAVRFYRALVQLLFPNIYERDAPITLGDDKRRQLDRLLSCFEDDLRRLPASVRGPVSVDSAKSRAALLQHVVAIKLALRAFDDHFNVRRIWRVDYRYQDLPGVSSDALFFIYYALDNCESADTVYAEHRGHWLPAHYRVNAALRHVDEFVRHFGCAPATDMTSGTSTCNVLKRH